MESDIGKDVLLNEIHTQPLRRARNFRASINVLPDDFFGTFRFTRAGIASIREDIGAFLDPEEMA